MNSRLTTVYRSPREEGLYLYVDSNENLSRVPEDLLKKFGKPELAMTFLLRPERVLARADTAQVLQALENRGFYLQLPPQKEDLFK